MLLIGHRVVSLDQKSRAVMPANFLAVLPQDLVMCKGFQESSLLLFSEETFEEYAKRSRELMSDDDFALWQRISYSTAMSIHVDDRGRFLLPTSLTELVPFEKEIFMYGLGNCLALCPEERKTEDNSP